MRVLVKRPPEHGAVAVLVAIMAITLFGLSAFVVDFGLAYNAKRDIQHAADAAALAAAGTFADEPGTCAEMLATPSLVSEAQAVADEHMASNVDVAAGDPAPVGVLQLGCRADGVLEANYDTSIDSPSVFGGILGNGDDIGVERTATAVLEAPPGGTGVRPLALCSADLPASLDVGVAWRSHLPQNGPQPSPSPTPTTSPSPSPTVSDTVSPSPSPSPSPTPPPSCPVPSTPGNWWTIDCPDEFGVVGADDGKGGTAQLTAQVANGCGRPISVVPGQDGLSGQPLNDHLTAMCPDESITPDYICLSGDPGQPDAGNVEGAWASLIDKGEVIGLPVFCAPSRCAQSSIRDVGTNAIFPVHRLVNAVVCGYHFGDKVIYQDTVTPSAACSEPAATTLLSHMASDTSKDVYLVLVSALLPGSSSTAEAACAIGTTCDTGVRRVRLTE